VVVLEEPALKALEIFPETTQPQGAVVAVVVEPVTMGLVVLGGILLILLVGMCLALVHQRQREQIK